MPQELDPDLAALFAAANRPLPADAFQAAVLRKIAAKQRGRLIRRCVLSAIVLLMLVRAAHPVLSATAGAIRRLDALAALDPTLIVSPWGWLASMSLGLAVILRYTPLLRRR